MTQPLLQIVRVIALIFAILLSFIAIYGAIDKNSEEYLSKIDPRPRGNAILIGFDGEFLTGKWSNSGSSEKKNTKQGYRKKTYLFLRSGKIVNVFLYRDGYSRTEELGALSVIVFLLEILACALVLVAWLRARLVTA